MELPGADHFVGDDPDQILDVIDPFLAECGAARLDTRDDRVVVTLLVTDSVGSTAQAAPISSGPLVDAPSSAVMR